MRRCLVAAAVGLATACSGGAGRVPSPASGAASASASLASPTAGAEAVSAGLQLDLQALGYDPGPITGQFTSQTQQALGRFQQDSGVPAGEQGALGPASAQALDARLRRPSQAIRALQSALTDVGLYTGIIDGAYNIATLAAVRALQQQSHLPVDGQFGPRTAAALVQRYGQAAGEPAVTTPPTTAAPRTYLTLGDTGPKVTALQQRLTALGYRPGAVTGTYDEQTASAVLAFQKREGLGRDGLAGLEVQAALPAAHGAGPRAGLPVPRIEVDIARQLVFVVLASQPAATLNASTGSGVTYQVPGGGGTAVAYTPVGSFAVGRKIAGDHVAPLGTLHDPMFFYQGWAVHGAANVPAYPASHGCVRISDADADWLFPQIPVGTAVVVYDTTGHSPVPGQTPPGAAPGY